MKAILGPAGEIRLVAETENEFAQLNAIFNGNMYVMEISQASPLYPHGSFRTYMESKERARA